MIGTLILSLALAPTLTLPVRVDGEGYLRFVRDGRIVYAASATLSPQGGLLGSKGLPLTPAIRVPGNAIRLEVDLSGSVVAIATGGRTTCGRLVLARFDSKPTEDQGFLVSMTRATLGSPGESLFGVIRSANTTANVPAQANPAPQKNPGSNNGQSGITSITVAQTSELETDTATLKDFATITGNAQAKQALEAIVYCSLPSIGIDMPVTASRIQALAKRAGITAQVQVPSGAMVRRKSQAIKHEDFVAVAIKAAQAKIGAELPMTCSDQLGDFKAPLGQIELKAEGVTTSGTNLTVIVAAFVQGKRVNSRSVNLKVDASARIAPGTIVKIVMKSAGLTVEIAGKTRTGGMVGQTVTVVTDTGTVLTGIVIGADQVEVKM